ncbi:MAG: DUF2860 domain-containing protein [Rheinheimera sp.]|nr:MAG: DUF2860 domain-containing protein [Rheinheimera sp.]
MKVSHGRLESDFKNETFDSFQKDNKSSVEIFYSHPGFMGYENLSFLCLAMWMHVESNIQFFDSDTKIIGVSFGYSW